MMKQAGNLRVGPNMMNRRIQLNTASCFHYTVYLLFYRWHANVEMPLDFFNEPS